MIVIMKFGDKPMRGLLHWVSKRSPYHLLREIGLMRGGSRRFHPILPV
jgi:hypothetical protein